MFKKSLLFIFSLTLLSASSFGQFFGTTRHGGTNGGGVIYRTNTDGTGYRVDYNFALTNPGRFGDYSQMIAVPSGMMYGTTRYGGKTDNGLLFRFDPTAGTGAYTAIVDFDDAKGKGTDPIGRLCLLNGKLYGVTRGGGQNFRGVIFVFDPAGAGTFTKLADLALPTGVEPFGGLAAASNGKLYGTTMEGGTNSKGTLYEFNPADNKITAIHHFDGTATGSTPVGELTAAAGNTFYGITNTGGINDHGTVFQFNPANGQLTKLRDFNTATTGGAPISTLVQASSGKYYGSCRNGGTSPTKGTLYEFDPTTAVITKVVNFNGTNGTGDFNILCRTPDDKMYASTVVGGTNDSGVIFEFIPTTGILTKKADFNGFDHGYSPRSSLALASNGRLYGTTQGGTPSDNGGIFEYTIATSAIARKVDFRTSATGAWPDNTLVQASNGKLLGIASDGGTYGNGVIYEFDPNTLAYAMKVDFNDYAGKGINPTGGLVLGNNGKYYSTTTGGGANGPGTIFEYDYVGAPTTITKRVDLAAASNFVFASTVVAGNILYVPSNSGGANSLGAIWEFNYITGSFDKFVDFNGTNGAYLVGPMMVASNGLLYGTTEQGGASNFGTLFSYNPLTHTLNTLVEFNGTNGGSPQAGLVEFEGKLYGVNTTGGTIGAGVLFSYDIATNVFTKKFDLTFDIAGSIGTLAVGANRKLYGNSAYSGTNSIGVLFQYDIDANTVTPIYQFDGTTGSHPGYGALLSATLPPYVPILSPDIETVGNTIEIQGSSFNPVASLNTVYFGPVKATVTAATPTKLSVIVPPGAAHNHVTVTTKHHTGYSFKPFISSFPGGSTLTDNSFEPKVDITTGGYPIGTVVADINRDGRPEIIVATSTANNLIVYRNQSTAGALSIGSFVQGSILPTGQTPVGLAVGDLDSDGDLDLVVTNNNSGSNTISIFPNNWTTDPIIDSSFGSRIDLPAGSNPFDVAIGDLDRDGHPDIVVSNINGAPVSIFRNIRTLSNTGQVNNSSFAPKFDLLGANTGTNSVKIADMDANGVPDIVIGQAGGNVSIYRGIASSLPLTVTSFAGRVDFTTGPVNGFAIGDIDGDRLPDMVVAADPTTVSMFRNISTAGTITTGSFAAKVDKTVESGNNVALADMDGDGKLDLVTTSRLNSAAYVYKNNNTAINASTFTSFLTLPTGPGPGSALLTDLDADGKPDVVTTNNTNTTTNLLSVIRNRILAAIPGAQPSGITFSNVTAESMTVNVVGAAAASADGYIAIMSLNQPPNIDPVNGVTYTPGAVLGQIATNDIKVVYTGNAASFNVSGLPAGKTVYFAVYSYKGGPGVFNYLTTTVPFRAARNTLETEPTVQASGITFSAVSTTSMTISFTNGNGASRIVVVKEGSAVDALPVDGVHYVPNTSVVGTQQIGANTFVVGNTSPVTITGTTANTTYHVRVFEFNGADDRQNYLTSTATDNPSSKITAVPDITKPSISPIPVGATASGAQVNVSATIVDLESQISNVTLYYRSTSAGGTPLEKPMTKGIDNVYSASIEPANIGELGAEYRITATSGGGTNSDMKFTGIAVSSATTGTTVNYSSFGTDQVNYRIIAVPLSLTTKTVSTVFDEMVGGINKKTWRLSHYDNGATRELTATDPLEPGQGYWLLIKTATTINTGPGNTVTTSSDENFSIDLKSGWNQIGNPYPFDILWTDMVAANTGLPVLRTYREDNPGGGNYPWGDGTSLRAKEGGFINNTGGLTKLKFPVVKKSSGRIQQDPSHSNPIDDKNWQLYLVAKNGNLVNNISGIGMREKASLEQDQFDGYSMPRFFERYIELNHTRKVGGEFLSMDIVPTSGEHTWEFNIETSGSEKFVTLEWDNTRFGDNNMGLLLWDDARQIGIDMRENNNYTFDRSVSGLFRVYFGGKSSLREKVEIRGLVLHSVSPNPSQEDVRIAFSVPGSVPVAFEAIDLLGRKIWSASGQFDKGYHEVTWEGETRVSACGMYIIRLKAGDQTQVARIYMK